MNKTYKKNSRHNVYDPSWFVHHVRIPVEMRVKLEKRAKDMGMGLAEFTRFVIGEAVKDVKLTSADVMEIARRIQINEEKNNRILTTGSAR